MGEVPDMTRQEVTIGTRHGGDLLKLSFCHQKGGSKRPAVHYFRDLSVWINALWWSDPDLLYRSKVGNARNAFTLGFQVTAAISIVILIATAMVVLTILRRVQAGAH